MKPPKITEAQWRAMQRRPPITVEDAYAVRDALPPGARWAIQDLRWSQAAGAKDTFAGFEAWLDGEGGWGREALDDVLD